VRAALRRLAVLLTATAAGVGALGALLGLATGSPVQRAASVAYYIVGAFLIVLGFFAGNRGPLRPRLADEEPIAGLFGMGLALRRARRATGREKVDALATAGIFLSVGAWLIILGVLADASVDLF
jgi:energy-converting hydrogenase Eha subunit E